MNFNNFKPDEDTTLKLRLDMERLKHYKDELKRQQASYTIEMTPEEKIKHINKVKKLRETIRTIQLKIKGEMEKW